MLTNGRRTPRYHTEGLQDLAIRQTSTLPEALRQVPLPAPRRPRGDSHRFDAIQFDAIFNAMMMRLNQMVVKTNKNIMLMTLLTRQNRMRRRRM